MKCRHNGRDFHEIRASTGNENELHKGSICDVRSCNGRKIAVRSFLLYSDPSQSVSPAAGNRSVLNDRHQPVKNILIISYLFPPVGGIGVQRALSMAKYLPACGFNVHILKATNAGGPVQ